MKFKIDKAEVVKAAKKAGYTLFDDQQNIGMISFTKADIRINVYLTTCTVATCITHPKKGKTQLFRKNVTIDQLTDLFLNPRKHTGKGYYKKSKV